MLEIEGYLKNYFKNEVEDNLDTIPEIFDHCTCWLYEKDFKLEDVKKIQLLKISVI